MKCAAGGTATGGDGLAEAAPPALAAFPGVAICLSVTEWCQYLHARQQMLAESPYHFLGEYWY